MRQEHYPSVEREIAFLRRLQRLRSKLAAPPQGLGLRPGASGRGRQSRALWGPKMWSCALARHDALASWGPMCRILYRLLVSLARLAVRSGRSKHLEIIVLRHQLTVLHRKNNRPALSTAASPPTRRAPGPPKPPATSSCVIPVGSPHTRALLRDRASQFVNDFDEIF